MCACDGTLCTASVPCAVSLWSVDALPPHSAATVAATNDSRRAASLASSHRGG
jgi:hypothetical protein